MCECVCMRACVRPYRREAGKLVSFLSLFIPPGSCVIKSDPASWPAVSPWHCPGGGDEGVAKYRSQSLLWHCPQPSPPSIQGSHHLQPTREETERPSSHHLATALPSHPLYSQTTAKKKYTPWEECLASQFRKAAGVPVLFPGRLGGQEPPLSPRLPLPPAAWSLCPIVPRALGSPQQG